LNVTADLCHQNRAPCTPRMPCTPVKIPQL
jgi:hypothetical protein